MFHTQLSTRSPYHVPLYFSGSMRTVPSSKYVLKGPIRTSQATDGQHTDELTHRRGGGGGLTIFGSHSARDGGVGWKDDGGRTGVGQKNEDILASMCFGFGQGIQGSECTFCSFDFLVASVCS